MTTDNMPDPAADYARLEAEVERLKTSLERCVSERTAELLAVNAVLQRQIDLHEIELDARARSNERLTQAIYSTSNGIVITDETQPDSPIIFCNPAFSDITGYPYDEVLGRNCRFLQGPDTDPAAVEELRGAVRHRANTVVELLNYRRDGTQFYNKLSLSPILAPDGSLSAYVGVSCDVSEQKALQAQLLHAQKMQAIGNLTGGIAHDFNNLLAVIIGNLELLEDAELPPDIRAEVLEPSLRAAISGAEMTQRLLAFSRRQPLLPVSVDLHRLITDTVSLLRHSMTGSIEISETVPASVWRCRADANQLQNALINLAVNARDALSGEGRIHVEASNAFLDGVDLDAASDAEPGPFVMLSVSDEGSGMSEEVLRRACEPFFTTKPFGAGSGLGLSMVYGFAHQSRGFMTIDSQEGKGTTVRLYLPKAPDLPGGATGSGSRRVL